MRADNASRATSHLTPLSSATPGIHTKAYPHGSERGNHATATTDSSCVTPRTKTAKPWMLRAQTPDEALPPLEPIGDGWEWRLGGGCRRADPAIFFTPENKRGAHGHNVKNAQRRSVTDAGVTTSLDEQEGRPGDFTGAAYLTPVTT